MYDVVIDDRMILCDRNFFIRYWRSMYRMKKIDMYEATRRLYNAGCRGAELRL